MPLTISKFSASDGSRAFLKERPDNKFVLLKSA